MSKPIRVLFIQSQTYYGADSRIHGLIMRYLDRSLAEVHVACNAQEDGKKSASALALEKIPDLHFRPTVFGASVFGLSKSEILRRTARTALPTIFSLVSLIFYIKKHRINIVHCTEKPRDAFYGYLLSRATGAKCVIHLHVKAEDWINKKVLWAMGKAHGLIGVSRFVADSIINMGFSAAKTYYAHNSIDLSDWQPNIDGSKIRTEFQIAPETPLVLIASRLFSWKGHSELLKALAIVKQQVPEFKLLIVGEDDPRAHTTHKSYAAELKTLTEELGLSQHVIFTGFRSDMPQFMAACDIFAMPSFEEPFGMVYLEAMAYNKPVIALNNGGSKEVIEDGVTGLLSEYQDIPALGQNLITLIRNPALREEMGKRGRERVENYFTPARLSSDILNIYQSVLSHA